MKNAKKEMFVFAVLQAWAVLNSAPYVVETVGTWSDPEGASFAAALQQPDVLTNGIQFGAELNSPTWTDWATGTNTSILLPNLTLTAADVLNIDLNSHTLAGAPLSFVSGPGSVNISNGTLGSAANALYFGADGYYYGTVSSSTVNASDLQVSANGAAYNSSVVFSNSTITANNISVYSNNTNTDVSWSDARPTFNATNSAITLNNGDFTMSGEGDRIVDFPLSQDPDTYHVTGRLDNSSISGVRNFIIQNGSALVLLNNASISTQNLTVTGAGEYQGYSAQLKGVGSLTWTGDMEISDGAKVDFTSFTINGEPKGSLYVGKNSSQNLVLAGGKISGALNDFVFTTLTLNGALTVDNASSVLVKDSAALLGVTDVNLLGGSKMKFTGKLAYNHAQSGYVGPTMSASGNLNVVGGSILALENGWQMNVAQNAAVNNGTVYVGVDLSKAADEDWGQGISQLIPTQLNVAGDLTVGQDSNLGSNVIIQGGGQVNVDGDMTVAANAGSTGNVTLDKDFTSTGAPASSGSKLNVAGNFVAGKGGDAIIEVGSSRTPDSSVSTGSTLLGAEAGSTARVTINGASTLDSLQYFYNPTNYAWRVTGAGETNIDNLAAEGDSSLEVQSGLVFLDGVFSMGAQSDADAGYATGTAGALGVAHFNSGNSELRLNNGSFVNRGSGANNGVGKVVFSNGAILSGQGSVYAGESIEFRGASIEPGSRFLYDDRSIGNPNQIVIGHLDLHVNSGNVHIDGGSRIRVAFQNPEGNPGIGSDVTVHGGNVQIDEGFVVDMYKIYEGEWRIMNVEGGVFNGSYEGYALSQGFGKYFSLNGHLLVVDVNGQTLQNDRILNTPGDIVTYYNADKTELWIKLSDIATIGNVNTTWTGAAGDGIWNMYSKNWDLANTNNTAQFLEGDRVTFIDGAANRNITVQTYGNGTGVTIVGMDVMGSDDWSFSGEGITTYNSELYTTLKLDTPDPLLRPTGQLRKIGAGTLTFNNANQFFGGVQMGDHNDDTTGGTIVLNNERALGTYDLSNVERGVNKGTVFMHKDGTIRTTANVNTIQNRFYVEDGTTLTLDVANDSLTVAGDYSYGLANELGALNGGGSFYVAGTVNVNKDLILSDNRAHGGGNLYIENAGNIVARSLTVQDSFATSTMAGNGGGGISFAGTGNHILNNLSVLNNNSLAAGGGIYVKGDYYGADGILTIGGNSTISGNNASGFGGGIYVDGAGDNGFGKGSLILDSTAGDIKFEGNLEGVDFVYDPGGENSLNPSDSVMDNASSNAVHVDAAGAISITGSNTVYFYDPISGYSSLASLSMGTAAGDAGNIVMHGQSQFSGDTNVNESTTLRFENGNFTIRGNEIKNGMASLGATSIMLNGQPDADIKTWAAYGGNFNLGENAKITGSGVIGARGDAAIKLDGTLDLDDGNTAYGTGVTIPDTIGTLNLIGKVSLAKTAVWNVTLDGTNFNADKVYVVGSSSFTDAAAKDNLTVNINDFVRGKYLLMETTGGISNFNTNEKKSGAVVWWNYSGGRIDVTKDALDGSEGAFYGRARASTYVQGNNLYLDINVRNRHIIANNTSGVWSDDNKWVYDPSTLAPSGGTLSHDWLQDDTGPATDVFINGDMVTFAPASGTQSYQINGTVRPVDVFVEGAGNVTFTGAGGINTLSPTVTADQNSTSINPVGSSQQNDYEIPYYAGKLTKSTASTLTFSNTGANTFAGGIDVGTASAAGGVIQFSNGNQLQVGSGKAITFIGDGTLRNTASTSLATNVIINAGKTVTYDTGANLTLIQSGLVSGDGGLLKIGTGTLALQHGNTFTGGVVWGDTPGGNAGTISIYGNEDGMRNAALGAGYRNDGTVTGLVSVVGRGILTTNGFAHSLSNRFLVNPNGALEIHSNNQTLNFNTVTHSGNGGAIYVDENAAAQLKFTGTGTLEFQNNSAQSGGAIYTAHTGGLDLTSRMIFTGNKATAGSGGAIYSAGDVVLTGASFNFSNNTASQSGGAIFAKNITVNATGAATISGNHAATGGAFYVDGGALNLNATGGDITFTGNTATTGGSAAYLAQGSVVSVGGSHNVIFYDTMDSAVTGNTFTKSGTGVVMFGNSGSEQNVSNFMGTTNVNQGQFRVIQNAKFGSVTDTATTFNLAAGAYLTGGGTIGANTAVLSGIVSADSQNNLRSEGTSHTDFNIGQLKFSNILTTNNATILTDMQGNAGAALNDISAVGTADTLAANSLNTASTGTFDLYDFSFGQYLLIDTQNTVNLTDAQLSDQFKFTAHGKALTDRQEVTILRGDNTINQVGTDKQVWMKAVLNNLYMYWTGEASDVWSTADSNYGPANWLNAKTASGKPAETIAINGDSVYFGDYVYDHDAGSFTGTQVSNSDVAVASGGVTVSDMLIDNGSVDYTYTGGNISSTATVMGDILTSDPWDYDQDNAPQNLTKKGTGAATFQNANNTFAGNLLMQGGTLTFANANNSFEGLFGLENGEVVLENTANTFAGGIFFRGQAADNRKLSFSTQAQLGSSDVTFEQSGTLTANADVELENVFNVESGATATMDSANFVGLAASSEISGEGGLTQTGGGILQISNGNANEVGGLTTIQEGTFRLANAGTQYGRAATGTFNTLAGTTLAGQGTINAKNMTISGIVTPDSAVLSASDKTVPTGSHGTLTLNSNGGGVTLQNFDYMYDMGTPATANTGSVPTGDLISITGAGSVTIAGSNTLTLSQGVLSDYGKYYLLVDANTAITSDGSTVIDPSTAFATVNYDGEFIQPRVSADIMFGNDTGVVNNKQLWLGVTRNTLDMTWNLASGGDWNSTGESWLSAQANNGVHSTVFNDGDYVHFNSNVNSDAKEVNVAGNVIVSGFDIAGTGDYTFTGTGSIEGKTSDATIEGKYLADGSIVPDGNLAKSGSGTATINNGANTFAGSLNVNDGTLSFLNDSNTFDSGIYLDGGTVKVTKAAQLTTTQGINFTGNATLEADADMTLAHNIAISDGKTATLMTDNNLTLSGNVLNVMGETGALAKTGTGKVTLTSAGSDYSGGTDIQEGTLEIAQGAATAGAAGSTVNVENAGTFLISQQTAAGDFTLDNVMTGGGTVIVNPSSPFAFGTASTGGTNGAGFTGTVKMQTTSYNIDAITSAFFAGGGTLETNAGSQGLVTDNSGAAWNLGNSTVRFNGGTMGWTFHNPNNPEGTFHANDIQIGTEKTKVVLNLDADLNTPGGPGSITGDSLFKLQLDSTTGGDSLLLATSNTDITGIATGNLELELNVGGNIQDATAQQEVNQDGHNVATGTFDYGIIASGNNLEVGYVLKKLEIYAGETLKVNRQYGDVQAFDVEITDKVDGSPGNVEFGDFSSNPTPGSPGSTGVLLNNKNTYTGTTTIRESTTLIMGQDYALGSEDKHTSNLILGAGSGYDTTNSKVEIAGTTQIIGALNITAGHIDLAGNGSAANGTLTITNAGNGGVSTVSGDNALQSSGTGGQLILEDGAFNVNGSNTGFVADVENQTDSVITLNKVDGLGANDSIIDNAGKLHFDGATVSGDFEKTLKSSGEVVAMNGADVTVTGNNVDYEGLFNAQAASKITVNEAKNLGTAKIQIDADGTFDFDTSTDWSLAVENTISGAGHLVKEGTGELTIGHANSDFTGDTLISDGTLKLTADNAIGAGDVENNATLNLAEDVTEFSNNISGSGQNLVSAGADVKITGDNSTFGSISTANWEIGGTATVTDQKNLGTAAVNIDGSTNGTLVLDKPASGSFDFINKLTGDGTLDVTLGGVDDKFAFNQSAGTAFEGTLKLQDSLFELGGDAGTQGDTNALAMREAELKASSGSKVDVLGDSTIRKLTFDGGTVSWNNLNIPPDGDSKGVIDATQGGIEITGENGTVALGSDFTSEETAGFLNPTTNTERNILDQDNLSADDLSGAILLAEGAVTGSTNSLKLVDAQGNAVDDAKTVGIYQENHTRAAPGAGDMLVAEGTYNYALFTDENNDNLYVGYALTEINLIGTGMNALVLDNTGANNDTLSALLTGGGDIVIAANGGQIVLSNGANDYTGQTTAASGTLVVGQDNALGQTSALNILTPAATDLNGKSQTVGALNIAAGGKLLFNEGALTVTNGGIVNGTNALVASGTTSTLNVQNANLTVTDANTSYAGTTNISQSGTATLNHAQGLGSGTINIEDTGTLKLDILDASKAGAGNPFAATIQGEGDFVVNTVAGSSVVINKANGDFAGATTVEHGRLVSSDAAGVGTSTITVQNSDSEFLWNGISSNPLNNDTTGDGTVIYNTVSTVVNGSQTAANYQISNGSILVLGDATVFGTSNTKAVVDNSSVLYANKVIGASVENNGLVMLAANGGTSVGGYSGSGHTRFANANGAIDGTLTVTGDMSGSQIFDNVLINFDGDLANRINVEGNLSGNYSFTINNIGDAGEVTSKSRIYDFILYGTESEGNTYDATVLNTGPYEFGLVANAGGNGYDIAAIGWGPGGQIIINTMGSMSMGWFTQLDSLLKRMGELRISQNNLKEGDFWFRGYGQQANTHLGIKDVYGFTDYQFGGDAGYDRIWAIDDDNYMAIGAFAGYTGSRRKIDDPFASKSNSDGINFGAYFTWMNSDGWYSDLVVKGQYIDSEYDTFLQKAHFKNWMLGASIEVGRQFINEDGWFLEPSAQAAYLHMFGSGFDTQQEQGNPYHTSTEAADVFRFQGMLRAGKNMFYEGYVFQPYIKGGAETQISRGGELTVSDSSLRPNTDGTRGVIGAGIVWQLNEKSQIHLDYEASFGDKYDVPWRVNAGYRFSF